MNKITSYSADYQNFPTLFELEPVAGKKVTIDFSAPELSSLGGLPLVREYEKSSNRIIEPHHRTHRILHQRSSLGTNGGAQPDGDAPPEDIPDNSRL